MTDGREQVAECTPGDAWIDPLARALQTTCARGQQWLADHRRRRQKLEALLDEQMQQLVQAASSSPQQAETAQQDPSLLGQLRGELRQLEMPLSRLLAPPPGADGPPPREPNASQEAEVEDLRERLEMAIDQLRELKATNAELEKELAAARAAGPPPSAEPVAQGLDWEAQKQLLLAKLESDFDEQDERQKADKLKVQDAIRATERILAEKEKEIDELKKLLEEQSSKLGEVAVGASAIGAMFDQDELIIQERENLRAMQQEWREKLRQAEIEISTERAKLARQRAELEEKLLALERSQANAARTSADGKTQRPTRGRWLARLGLTDPQE